METDVRNLCCILKWATVTFFSKQISGEKHFGLRSFSAAARTLNLMYGHYSRFVVIAVWPNLSTNEHRHSFNPIGSLKGIGVVCGLRKQWHRFPSGGSDACGNK